MVASNQSESHAMPQLLNRILSAAAPSLVKTGKPEEYVDGVYTRLLELLKLQLKDKKLFAEAVANTHEAFGLEDDQKEHFNQLFEMLAEKIIENAGKQSVSANEFIANNINKEKIIKDLMLAVANYKEIQKPKVLRERQQLIQASLENHPVIKNARRKITSKESENATSYDYYFYIGNHCYQMPGGYKLYADWGWVPPKQFVNDIMQGGLISINIISWRGTGGYISGKTISFDVLDRIKQNTFADRLHYMHKKKGMHTFTCGNIEGNMNYYNIGYLFGVQTPDGREYDIDAHGGDESIKYAEGNLVEFGKVIYKGKDVTKIFWDRVHALTNNYNKNQAKAHDFELENQLKKAFTQMDVPAYDEKKPEAINNLPVKFATLLVAPPNDYDVKDGLITRVENTNDNEILDPEIIKCLKIITHAKEAIAYIRPPAAAKIEIEIEASKPITLRYDNKTKDAAYWGRVESSNKYFTDVGTYAHASCFGLERALGRQGKFINASFKNAHTRLEFNSRAELESAVDLLTKPGKEIVLPFDVKDEDNVLYLEGQVDTARVLQLASKEKPSPTSVVTVQAENHTTHHATTEEPAKDVKANAAPTASAPAKALETALMTQDILTQIEAKLAHAIVPAGIRDSFHITYSEQTGNCEIVFDLKESKASDLAKTVANNIIGEAFETLQSVAADAKATMTTKKRDKKMMATMKAQDLHHFSAALATGKDNERLVGSVAAELDAVNALLTKSSNPDFKDNGNLEGLAVLSGKLLPINDLKLHRMEVMDRTLTEQLKQAVQANDLASIKELVSLGANPSTALGIAASEDAIKAETLICLLTLKASPEGFKTISDIQNNLDYFETPLYKAASKKNYAKVKALIDYGADMGVVRKGIDGATPLVASVIGGDVNIAVTELLLEKGGTHTFENYGIKKDVDLVLRELIKFKDEQAAVELLNKLIAAGATVNNEASYHSPLYSSVKSVTSFTDNLLVKRFVELGATFSISEIASFAKDDMRNGFLSALFDLLRKTPELIKVLPPLNKQDKEDNSILHTLLNHIHNNIGMLHLGIKENMSFLITQEKNKLTDTIKTIRLLQKWPRNEKLNITLKNHTGESALDLIDKITRAFSPQPTSVPPSQLEDKLEKGLLEFRNLIAELKDTLLSEVKADNQAAPTAKIGLFSGDKKDAPQTDIPTQDAQKAESVPAAVSAPKQGK